MNWEAGLIDRMEKMVAIHSVMSDYYNEGKPNLGEYAQSHSQEAVDVVSEVLKILGED
jgi:hypothetical protein